MLICDTFEPPGVQYIIKQRIETTTADLTTLGYCDYLWYGCDNHSITVERKEVHDFTHNVDRLENQLKRALTHADEVILLIEGVMSPVDAASTVLYREKKDGGIFFRDRVINRPYTFFTNFLWRLDKLGVSHFYTADIRGTGQALTGFYLASQDPEYTTFKRYIKIKPTIAVPDPTVVRLMGLGLGEKRAIALKEKFGSVWNVLHATDKELLSVEGIGKKTIDELMKGVGKDAER